ncbi:MAG: hypothetical protein Q4B16_04580 [Bacteroidia bacterium]|nr:hypothetical protein [Bacteroidia bacterium]
MDATAINKTIAELSAFMEKENFRGWDPYDYLNSWIPFRWFGKMAQAVAVQAGKLIPFNLRPLMGIRKEENPKGLGLMLHAYCNLYDKTGNVKYLKVADYLYERLLSLRSPGKTEYCWGYDFIWANPQSVHPKYMPSVVVSSFVGQGIYRYYRIKQDEGVKKVLVSIGNYVTNSLQVTETEDGICFSYTEEEADCCYNASLLGAEILAIVYTLSKEETLLKVIRRNIDFILAHQHEDGSWGYSIDVRTGKERIQVDFHQGFILCSLGHIKNLLALEDARVDEAIRRGLRYYRGVQFNVQGVSKWRVPKEYPVEIHNQAQGIITFSEFSSYDEEYKEFAERIADWTIAHMYSRKKGYFYYRKFKRYTIRIPYMRWSQAWMLLALSTI